MGLIKYFNRSTLSWEIVAASDAANIALHNEILQDSSDAAISTARAFLKINNKISQLEHHLAWIYLNGAKGGGGGGGGGGGYAYTITINNGKDTFYTSTNSITINMTINSGTTRKTFYVNAINMATGRMLVDGESHTSMVPFDFTIPNLPSATNYIYLQAYDSLDNYTELVEIVVNVGSLSIVQSGRPGAIYTIGSNNNTVASFQVLNKTGSNSYLLTYRTRNVDPLTEALSSGGSINNNFGADYMTVITPNTQAAVYSIDFNQDLMLQDVGRVVTYRTILYSAELGFQSSYFSNQITISTGNALSVILYGLGETLSDAGDYMFELNNYCTFNLLLYYEKVDVRNFYYKYKVYKGEELFYESQISTMQASTSTPTTINCPTQNFALGDDYRLVVEACATDDFDASHNQNLYSTTRGYFGIKQGQVGILQDYKGALLARFGSFNFPGGQLTRWTYNLAHSGDYYFTSWPASAGYSSTSMDIHNATITTGLNTNVYRYVNLSGNTYATINEFSTLFPQSTNINNSLFGTGFYMQVTYEYLSDSPVDLTILSFGEYQNGSLYKGFEINSDYIRVAFGTISGIQIDTPVKAENAYGSNSAKSTRTTTVGLNVWSTTVRTKNNTEQNTYYFALYIDGVMTKCALIPDSVLQNASTGWMFGQPLYLGCRPDLTNQANCYIYDFKLYAQNQPDLSIVHNYMSATEQAHLILSSTGQPTIDDELDTILRNKNLFVKGGNTCILCDTSTGEYLDPATMYSRIASSYSDVNSGYDLDYPIVYIEEVGVTSDMYQCVKATWDVQATIGGVRITKKAWPVKITITTKYGTTVVYSDNPSLQPTVLIQGTSSLSYNSKNLEIIMGQVEEGKDKLLKINGWLPENEFTLKADVVDSAHVNNVAIGNFVNNTEYIEHYAGSGYSVDDTIGRKIKKTSEGFPCLVFVKYSNGSVDEGTNITRDTDGTILSKVGKTEFMGVYNFNLGRYAYFNLGLKKLISYLEDTTRSDLAPQIITEYSYSEPDGIYSMEVGDNFGNTEELFTQADKTISEYITECRYTPTTEDNAYQCITDTVFTMLAQADASTTFNRKRRTANGEYEDILDNYGNVLQWVSDSTLSDEVTINLNLDLEEARKYLVLALVFGLVDSVCKNMVFRTWNATRWVLAFYDMDTAFKKDNRGSSSVKYDAHYNYFFNTQGIYDDAMNSYTESVTLFPRSVDDPNWKYVYAGMCSSTGTPNRIWNTIQQCDGRKITSGDYATTLPGMYWLLRNLYIKDPDAFIDEYFSDYVNKTGAIMYNYDYRQKYVSYNQIWQEGVGLVADTSASQTEFLDGTRVSQVRTWFKKRINFLDSVYASFREGNASSDSYLKDSFQAGQKSTYTVATVTIVADLKCKIGYAASSGNVRYIWVDENPRSYNLQTQTEGNLFYIYGQSMITLFPGFNKLGWETFNYAINFKLLRELDMSGLHVNAFTSSDNLSGLPNVRILNLNDFVYEGNNSVTVGLTHNESLKELYMGGECNLSSFLLPSTGTLEVLDLTGNSYISSIPTQTVNGVTQSCLIDQSGLRVLKLSGTSITNMYGQNLGLVNLPSLETLELPSGLEKLTISNCGLTQLNYTWNNQSKLSKLTHIEITNCDSLEVINLSGQNNLVELSIYNCPNVKEINLNAISARTVNIDFSSFPKLEKLIIDTTSIFTSLNLTNCPNLFGLSCKNCMNLKSVICTRDDNNYIELLSGAFTNCVGLNRLVGYFELCGSSIFEGCGVLPFDDLLDSGDIKIRFGDYNDFSKTFKGCLLLGQNSDYPMLFIWALPPYANNISEMFYETSSNFLMDPDMFCRKVNGLVMNLNVTTILGVFSGTKISGNFYSEYYDDGVNHGFFAHMPNLLNCESAFANSNAERYIDNDFFHNAVSRNLTNVDYMFSFNTNLKAVNDTTGTQTRVLEPLHTKDFFIYLENCIHPENRTFEAASTPYPDWPYPIGVFLGTEIRMTVDLDLNGKPFLFHHAKQSYASKRIYLENGLYLGIHLILDPNNCNYSYLFGGNSSPKSISDGVNTYYIPKFVRINEPFYASDELYLDLSGINGQEFFDETMQYILYPFKGMNVLNTDTIPDDIFRGALNVLQLKGFFNGLNLNNLSGDQVYDFAEHDIFQYCTSLLNIESIFSDCNNFRMRLASNMFRNCKLVNVLNAFYHSRIIEKLPDRLFYMEDSHGNVLRTINNMLGVFEGCYNLGYMSDYTFARVPRNLSESDSSLTTWNDHIYQSGTFLGNNYTLPQDIFWYCAANASIGDVLGLMFWRVREAVEDLNNPGIYLIQLTDTWVGPQCTIPSMLLSNPETEISKSDTLTLVFSGTHFKPSGTLGTQGEDGVYARGNLYPDDLFTGMSNLENISGMFRDTEIYKECMINPDLFVYGTHLDDFGNTVEDYLPLKNISSVWQNCKFSYLVTLDDLGQYQVDEVGHPLIDFTMFDPLNTLTNASYLFAASRDNDCGLRVLSDDLFKNLDFTGQPTKTFNITGMFLDTHLAVTSTMAPVFPNVRKNLSAGYNTYLNGLLESLIINAAQVRAAGLYPVDWDIAD